MLHIHKNGEKVPDVERPYSKALCAYYVDFGLAKFSNGAGGLHTLNRGTKAFMAPVSLPSSLC